MRVTHIITRLVIGGAQENTLATLRGLRNFPDLSVQLVTGPSSGPEGSLETEARSLFQRGSEEASQSPDFILVPELVRPVHPLKDLIALHKLEKILRLQKPDIVHTHSGKAGILGRLAAKRAGVPVIIHHIHGPSFGPFQGALANKIFTAAEKHAARVTDHFFCSADAMTKLYLAADIGNPSMFTRVFSGFNLEPFLRATNDPALRRQLGLDARHFVIGKIGRMFKLKGHADLLTAFATLLPQVPNARLLLVGDGVLRSQIERQAHDLGLFDKIIFTGLVPPHEVPRYVGIMDCLAHLSYREALSRALPQAMAAGKPVVAYNFDGAEEICQENRSGFVVPIGDTQTAAQRLLQLAGSAARRDVLGRAGQHFVRENFSIEKMVDTQHSLYMQLAAEHGLPA